jgi:hypothetical protein
MTIERLIHRSFLVLFLLGATLSLHAQEGDEYDFNDIPVDDQALPYIGVGGGYLGMVGLLNYDELNKIGEGLGMGTEGFKGPMWLHGGGGFTAIYVVPNVRLGIYGSGGNKEVSRTVMLNNVNYKRTLRFNMSMTAVQADYAIPLVGKLTAFPGIMFGLSNYELNAIQYKNDTVGFGSIFGSGGFDAADSSANFNRETHLSTSTFFVYPAVNLEYALTQFFLLRLGAGYGWSFPYGEWETSNGVVDKDAPNLKANGAMVQFGLFIGLFQ